MKSGWDRWNEKRLGPLENGWDHCKSGWDRYESGCMGPLDRGKRLRPLSKRLRPLMAS